MKMVLQLAVAVMVVMGMFLVGSSGAQKCPYLANNIDTSFAQGSPITLAQQYQAAADCFITQLTLELFTNAPMTPEVLSSVQFWSHHPEGRPDQPLPNASFVVPVNGTQPQGHLSYTWLHTLQANSSSSSSRGFFLKGGALYWLVMVPRHYVPPHQFGKLYMWALGQRKDGNSGSALQSRQLLFQGQWGAWVRRLNFDEDPGYFIDYNEWTARASLIGCTIGNGTLCPCSGAGVRGAMKALW